MSHPASVIEPPSRSQRMLLRGAVPAALLFAVIGATIPGMWGRRSAIAAVTVIVAAPLLRVVLLCVRWARIRDLRFALVGLLLLAVVATGALLAAR